MPRNRTSTPQEQDRTERPSLYKTVTDRIISELREGAAPWVRPWSRLGDPFPRNGLTGRSYQGNNILLLLLAAEEEGFASNEWFTYLQAKEAGGQVRGGEHGTHILKAGRMAAKDDDAPEQQPEAEKKDTRVRRYVKTYVVFNREQIDGLPEKPKAPELPEAERITRAEAFIRATEAHFTEHGDRACYVPDLDFVALPPFSRFNHAAGYYNTAFHELIHWSGASHRLNRLPDAVRGTPAYALEELTAEVGAALLCAHFGIDGDMRHPGYIALYIGALEENEAAFFRAATAARHAVAYLLDLTGFGPLDTGEGESTDEDEAAHFAQAA